MNRGRIDENLIHWLIAIGNIEGLGLDVCIRVSGEFQQNFYFLK